MKRKFKSFIIIVLTLILTAVIFTGCSMFRKGVVSIQKTSSEGEVSVYTVIYSDGSTSFIEVEKGKDGQDVTIEQVYAKFLQNNPNVSYEEFLDKYLTLTVNDGANSRVVAKALTSVGRVYCEFPVQVSTGFLGGVSVGTSVSGGSAVIYKIDQDYTYFITNYHVIYNVNSLTADKTPKKIVCNLYGSESTPKKTNSYDSDGLAVYDYGLYAIECEYVGGAITKDIAVIKAKTSDVLAINDGITAVNFGEGYRVGETAIAIGNPEGMGISVTEGVVSVESEYIGLKIDNTTRAYRSLRIDTSIYAGSSGGGLFNDRGELIGITNAGNEQDQNINFAIPIEIVKPTVENIMYYYNGSSSVGVKELDLGIELGTNGRKYVYDENTGLGEIVENVYALDVSVYSLIYQLGIRDNDRLTSIKVGDNTTKITREFNVAELMPTVRVGDEITINYIRDGQQKSTTPYTVLEKDLTEIK